MGAYSYRALTDTGSVTKGVMEGDSERQIRSQLRAQSLRPLEVKATKSSSVDKAPSRWQRSSGRLKAPELALFTRQLATLVESGLPLTDALKACAKQNSKPRAQELILQTRSRVQEGHSLAYALGENSRSFDALYRATVEAGESAGYLGPVLTRLAEYCEAGQNTVQKLRSAMAYPLVLLAVSIIVVAVLMTKVVPQMVDTFTRRGQELPLPTMMLIDISNFFVNYGLHLLLGVILAVVGFALWLRSDSNRKRWHRLQLKIPVIGEWKRALDCSRFSATLSILVSSGVPLLNALQIARQVMLNLELRDRCETVVTMVAEGSSLNLAMDRAEVFPPLLVQMVASGELSGELGDMLARAAENQERELDYKLSAMMSILPPAMVVFMGLIVAFIVAAVLLPVSQQINLI
ncbi:type II secretion system inner membrane protein GspF [bacterium SCSIO 12696]|nr:type II secretion system inner membrane protein GspF [bacterium SCSIO 12696]